MKINKQLFEDILSGKLKGTFVFRNQLTCSSDELTRNTTDSKSMYPYCIKSWSYAPSGIYHFYGDTDVDIVDFIPETNMETKELKIEIPEGFEIDKENSSFEKIVFKKKENARPKSWEEYCSNFKGRFYYIQDDRNNIATSFTSKGFISAYKNILPSKELAEAFLAMMQLMSLRQAWVGDWKSHNPGFLIMLDTKRNIIVSCGFCYGPLTFPTKEMAVDFMNCFKDLLEIAKPLI